MAFCAGIVVRIADRVVLAQHFGDPATQSVLGELVTRCGTPNFRSTFVLQLPNEPRKVGVHIVTDSTTGIAVVSDEFTTRRVGHHAADEITKAFIKQYPEGVAMLSPKLAEGFAAHLATLLQNLSQSSAGGGDAVSDKAKKVRGAVEDVKNLAMDNVERVLERGQKIDDIVAQTDELQAAATGFHRSSRDLRNAMWWATMRGKLVVGGVAFAFLLIVYLVFCGGFSCSSASATSSS